MRKTVLAILSVLVVASMLVAACGGGAPATQAPAEPAATEAAAVEPRPKRPPRLRRPLKRPAEPTEEAAAAWASEGAGGPGRDDGGRTQVRWFVGLGQGTSEVQQGIQQEVVKAFNDSQDKIELVLEVVPYEAARDTLSTQIASGDGPDLIGPVGWGGSNAFYGQWLDLGVRD